MKTCSKCFKPKDLDMFYKDASKPDGKRPECIVCSKEYQKSIPSRAGYAKEWRANNKDALRNQNLKAAFGITLATYNEMFTAQDGKCAVCKNPAESFKRNLAVDHCHKTGNVRGLLCSSCNTALGLLKENLQIIESLKLYILSKGTSNAA